MSWTSSKTEPLVVGIVGGIASGKSHVTNLLREYGASVVVADAIAHEVLKEPFIMDEIANAFGPSVFVNGIAGSNQSSRAIDRKAMASLVFGDSESAQAQRRKLEAIVHPRIRQIAVEQLNRMKKDPEVRFVVLDVPLLVENGWVPLCDRVLWIDTPDELRQKYAAQRGWSEAEWRKREAAQASLSIKQSHATDTIQNTGDPEQLRDEVSRLSRSFALQ